MTYKFKGYDWTELAECWGIKVEDQPLNIVSDDEEFKKSMTVSEKIDVTKRINGMKITFEVSDEEEVLTEKIKNYIFDNLDYNEGLKNNIRADMESFLNALLKAENKLGYCSPMIKGLKEIEDDYTFSKWFCHCIELLWT